MQLIRHLPHLRLRPAVAGGRWRAPAAGLTGLLALAAGVALGAVPLALTGPAPGPVLWAALGAAGLALIVLALRAALAGRGWWARAGAALACLAALQWVVVPAVTAGMATAAGDRAVPAAGTLGLPGAREATFPARDGTRLAAWYVPGTTGAAVVLLHGSHGTRAGTLAHLRMLARAGLAVLAVDARGHGRSAGATNALGWHGADDVAGAVAYLRRQPGVDPGRIAALGLSMGAESALRAAAEGVPLAAVVADGAGASTLGDMRITGHGVTAPVALSSGWVGLRLAELLSGDEEPAPLAGVVGRIRVPVLLVASGAGDERGFGAALARRMGRGARLWVVPEAGHTHALAARPEAYASRVHALLRARA